jgi:hypothetical protein
MEKYSSSKSSRAAGSLKNNRRKPDGINFEAALHPAQGDDPGKGMKNQDKPQGMPTPVYDADAEPPEIVWEPNRYIGVPGNAPKKPTPAREPHWIEPKKKGQLNLFGEQK